MRALVNLVLMKLVYVIVSLTSSITLPTTTIHLADISSRQASPIEKDCEIGIIPVHQLSVFAVDKDERMSEEDRSARRSDGAARSRASEEGHSVSSSECLRATDNASISAAVSEPPEGIDNENEAAPLHRQQTSASRHDVPQQPGRKETFFGIPQSGAPPNFNPSMFSTGLA